MDTHALQGLHSDRFGTAFASDIIPDSQGSRPVSTVSTVYEDEMRSWSRPISYHHMQHDVVPPSRQCNAYPSQTGFPTDFVSVEEQSSSRTFNAQPHDSGPNAWQSSSDLFYASYGHDKNAGTTHKSSNAASASPDKTCGRQSVYTDPGIRLSNHISVESAAHRRQPPLSETSYEHVDTATIRPMSANNPSFQALGGERPRPLSDRALRTAGQVGSCGPISSDCGIVQPTLSLLQPCQNLGIPTINPKANEDNKLPPRRKLPFEQTREPGWEIEEHQGQGNGQANSRPQSALELPPLPQPKYVEPIYNSQTCSTEVQETNETSRVFEDSAINLQNRNKLGCASQRQYNPQTTATSNQLQPLSNHEVDERNNVSSRPATESMNAHNDKQISVLMEQFKLPGFGAKAASDRRHEVMELYKSLLDSEDFLAFGEEVDALSTRIGLSK